MATSARKVEIDGGDIWNIFAEMFIEKSCTFHMTFVKIAKFCWLPGRLKKGKFLKKKVKKSSSQKP